MQLIFLFSGLLFGFGLGYLFFRMKSQGVQQQNQEQTQQLERKNGELNGIISQLEARIQEHLDQASKAEFQRNEMLEKLTKLEAENAAWKTRSEHLNTSLEEQKKDLEELNEKLKLEFKNIAQEVLNSNSKAISNSQEEKLKDMLNPFNEKLKDFETKVEQVYDTELRDKLSLKKEVEKLYELNQRINEEAKNLTKALKGDSKVQGNWGEFILEKVLESSGLRAGSEYTTQEHSINEEGRRIQPDVVVHLPNDKHVIVDAKVSLTAYEAMMNADDEEERSALLKEHLASIKRHIKGLSEKNYPSAKTLNAPDFVLLFIPIESSLHIALQAEKDLYAYSWERKIVLVTPSILLATLKIIHQIWSNEKQLNNHIEIAQKAGALYDKFVGFLTDMQKMEKGLDHARTAYEEGMKKLSTGKGNLVRKSAEIKELGAKANKHIPEQFSARDNELEA